MSRYFGPAEVSAAAAAADAAAAALYFGIRNLVDSIGNQIWDGIWQYLMVFIWRYLMVFEIFKAVGSSLCVSAVR